MKKEGIGMQNFSLKNFGSTKSGRAYARQCNKDFVGKRGQVWIETVIYTLIAFVMIGLVLSFAKPKIEEIQDKAVIEQSVKVLEEINNVILTMGGPGNKRLVELGVKKGSFQIDGVNDRLLFEIDGKHAYSQPGENVSQGDIIIYTEKKGDLNTVTLIRDYSSRYDITYQGANELKTISKASAPYQVSITNKGGDGRTIIDFDVS